MIVNVEEIITLESERDALNNTPLEELDFIYNGKLVNISKEELDHWKFIGLNNIDFIRGREW